MILNVPRVRFVLDFQCLVLLSSHLPLPSFQETSHAFGVYFPTLSPNAGLGVFVFPFQWLVCEGHRLAHFPAMLFQQNPLQTLTDGPCRAPRRKGEQTTLTMLEFWAAPPSLAPVAPGKGSFLSQWARERVKNRSPDTHHQVLHQVGN